MNILRKIFGQTRPTGEPVGHRGPSRPYKDLQGNGTQRPVAVTQPPHQTPGPNIPGDSRVEELLRRFVSPGEAGPGFEDAAAVTPDANIFYDEEDLCLAASGRGSPVLSARLGEASRHDPELALAIAFGGGERPSITAQTPTVKQGRRLKWPAAAAAAAAILIALVVVAKQAVKPAPTDAVGSNSIAALESWGRSSSPWERAGPHAGLEFAALSEEELAAADPGPFRSAVGPENNLESPVILVRGRVVERRPVLRLRGVQESLTLNLFRMSDQRPVWTTQVHAGTTELELPAEIGDLDEQHRYGIDLRSATNRLLAQADFQLATSAERASFEALAKEIREHIQDPSLRAFALANVLFRRGFYSEALRELRTIAADHVTKSVSDTTEVTIRRLGGD